MTFSIQDAQFHVLPMRTRIPFKYGIASLTSVPHLFMTVTLRTPGGEHRGLASEGLPPKWFTKNPDTSFEEDVSEMLAVIQNAARIGQNASQRAVTFFRWWRDLYDEQAAWARVRGCPGLLAGLGTSLIERAVLDALCRAAEQPLHQLLRTDALALDLGSLRAELKGVRCPDFLPEQPAPRVFVRQTIGLGDTLRAAELTDDERLDDGLPCALDEVIRAYGLRYFKIKVTGRLETDLPRLREITAVLRENCPGGFKATLDGNEQFNDLASFAEFFARLRADATLRPLFESIFLLEQPLHRDHAMQDAVGEAFAQWSDGPGIIIDESDGSLDDLPRALALGYRGTSHKNCKGIVKGLANAASIHLARERHLERDYHLSGEDLCGIGPVAMLMDTAMMATLGITNIERNGHHYFRGLSMYPTEVQEAVLAAHGGFYRRHEAGFPALDIHDGMLDLATLNAAPFGHAMPLDASQFEPLNAWIKRGGIASL